MVCRLLLLLGMLIALAASAAAQSTPKAKSDPAARKDSRPPLVFYLAKGEDDACGPGCSEWIAAEGTFDVGATQRLRVVLNRLGKRKLPIFFHSLGGDGREGMAMGRLLRQFEMTAGVSETVPAGCSGKNEQDCRALKQSGPALPATLRSYATCSSACLLALIGGKERHVPPGVRIGIHSARIVWSRADGSRPKVSTAYEKKALADVNAQMRRYFHEMKIEVRLFDLALSFPHEDVHFLSRDEIVDFGVSNHEIKETRWVATALQLELWVVKFFVEAADGKGPHTSMLRVDCGGPNRTRVVYYRSMGSSESGTGATRVIKLKAGPSTETTLSGLMYSAKMTAIETGSSYTVWGAYPDYNVFDVAAATDTIELTDSESANAKPRVVKLSTAGLASAMTALRRRCSGVSG